MFGNRLLATITITMPRGTDVTKLTPVIATNGVKSLTPGTGETVDFTNAVTYTAAMEDGNSKTYTVTVYVDKGTLADQFWDMSVGNPTGVQYLRCSKRADSKSCDGCGTLRTREFERFLYGEMVKKLSEFQTLTAKRETVNPKLTALNMELARVEDEIEKLLNTLTGANAVLLSYANSKIEELDTRRQALTKEIAALSAETMSPEQIERLSVYLNQWEEIDFRGQAAGCRRPDLTDPRNRRTRFD
jgi:uncharacterized small protein (DUF1192 family)